MSEENMTVRELIEKVNAELKTNFEKDVIKLGYNKYDRQNGRKVIDVQDASRIIGNVAGSQFSFYPQKFNVEMYNTYLVFKTKRKKSGMVGYDHTDQLTVVEIYTENTDLLDRTLQNLVDETQENRMKHEQYKKQKEESAKQKIIDTLTEHNLSLKEFKTLMNLYKSLSYEQQKEIEEMV